MLKGCDHQVPCVKGVRLSVSSRCCMCVGQVQLVQGMSSGEDLHPHFAWWVGAVHGGDRALAA